MQYDAIIIGGSFAGLSAALYLGRARRSVCVLDTRKPRNRFTDASHGQFAQDGSDPQAMLATMRAQVVAYPTVRLVEAQAIDATRDGDAFSVTLANGDVVRGTAILLAFGITDMPPDLPGLAERWGVRSSTALIAMATSSGISVWACSTCRRCRHTKPR